MTKDGEICYDKFCISAYRLMYISDLMNDQWRMHGSKDVPGSLYLMKQQPWGSEEHVYAQCLLGEAPHQWGMDVAAKGALSELARAFAVDGKSAARPPRAHPFGSLPPAALSDSSGKGTAPSEQLDRAAGEDVADPSQFWEYHVVYSQSFSVPVLYFRCWDAAGKPLTLADVWRNVSPNFQGRIAEEKWSLLTQQEHPVLKSPFFCLHPCHTKDMMTCIENSWNPIISWLSAVGPAVGLQICPLYSPDLLTLFLSEADTLKKIK